MNEEGLKKYRIKKIPLTFFLLIIQIVGFAQNSNIEYWYKLADEAKINGNFESAISYYEKILEIQPDDYDANLALAKLFYLQGEYEKAIPYFINIHLNDSTDLEALKGLGDCYLYLNNLDTAAEYYNKAVLYSQSYVPAYLQLAKVYSWQGKLDKSVEVYNRILLIDSTYSEAWMGIGKMLYWQEKPEDALSYYSKALILDPEEEKAFQEYTEISNLLKFQVLSTFEILNETEENYQINALIQKYNIQKRISNNFNIAFYFLFDYSDRNFTNTDVGDTTRWFDNTSVKIAMITEHNSLNVYGGYSASDNKFSSYGINWKWKFPVNSFDFTNSLTAGYDYFYYWNKVGQYIVSDDLSIRYRKLGLNIGYAYGVIDRAKIKDVYHDKYDVDYNNYNSFNISLFYEVLSNPKINIAYNYSYLNYEYKSPLYYSPLERNLNGPSATIYHSFDKFYFFGSFSYNIGSELYYDIVDAALVKNYLDVDSWSAEAELGYNFNSFTLNLSANRFYNPFYSNFIMFLSAKIYF